MFSTTDLSRKVGDIVTAALKAPVTLTQDNKPRLVLLSIEEYEGLKFRQAPDTRSVGLLREMPPELAKDFRQAALPYIKDTDKT